MYTITNAALVQMITAAVLSDPELPPGCTVEVVFKSVEGVMTAVAYVYYKGELV